MSVRHIPRHEFILLTPSCERFARRQGGRATVTVPSRAERFTSSVSPVSADLGFAAFGFAVVSGHVDVAALSEEFDRTMADAFEGVDHLNVGQVGNQFRYVPMMCEHTLASVGHVLRLAALAADMLGCEVLPGRAKGTTYVGSADWHRDSDLAVRSVGIATYLEPLTAGTGALRVLPGTHHDGYASAVSDHLAVGGEVPFIALETVPGDLIVFDEHLYHGSSGGLRRRQWRVDFVADDGNDDALAQWYTRQYSVGWDAGYDVDRYPSYGPKWQQLAERWNRRLTALGAYHAAEAEESAVRDARSLL